MSTNKDEDTRPLISDLLSENSTAINTIRDMLISANEELYKANASRYDDIWILRYILSHKKDLNAAFNAAKKTMEFREEKKLNEIGNISNRIFPAEELFRTFCDGDLFHETQPDENRGIVQFVFVKSIDMTSVGSNMSHEDLVSLYMYTNESVYQTLDEVTRRTGRLTKCLKVVDCDQMQLRKLDRLYLKKDGAASKVIEDYYPQLLGTVLVVNCPYWLNKIWNTLRIFFPRRFVEKVDIVPSYNNEKSKRKSAKRFAKYIAEENLPWRYGGKEKKWPLPSRRVKKKDSN